MPDGAWDNTWQRVNAGQFVWSEGQWKPATPNGGGGSGGTVDQGTPGAQAWPVTFLTPPTVDVGTVPVTGTFWQATQPVSGPLTDAQLRATPVPVTGAGGGVVDQGDPAATANAWPTTIANVVTAVAGTTENKTQVMQTGLLTTTSVVPNQVVSTYTVTTGKTLYLTYLTLTVGRTAINATATRLGSANLQIGGVNRIVQPFWNPTTSQQQTLTLPFPEPLFATSGIVVRVVANPMDATSTQWWANFGGYER